MHRPADKGRKAAMMVAIALGLGGCGKSSEKDADLARTPQQAASQMDQAFSTADPTTKQLATAASEALRKGEYENAVISLQTVRANPEMTAEQRLAIYSSAVTLEARLISAMDAGDKRAERAYQLLKELKKK